MFDLFFADGAAWFSIPALIGTVIFILRLVLMLIGGDHAFGDMDIDTGAVHGDPSAAFQLISFQSITAFAMGAGWAGLAAYRPMGMTFGTSALVGVAGGAGMVWVLAVALKSMFDLESSGNVNMSDTVGLEGAVYATVPARGEGRGQVKVIIGTRQRIYNAVSASDAIVTGARARVIAANEDNTLTVAPVV